LAAAEVEIARKNQKIPFAQVCPDEKLKEGLGAGKDLKGQKNPTNRRPTIYARLFLKETGGEKKGETKKKPKG